MGKLFCGESMNFERVMMYIFLAWMTLLVFCFWAVMKYTVMGIM